MLRMQSKILPDRYPAATETPEAIPVIIPRYPIDFKLPTIPISNTFIQPTKQIQSPKDVQTFTKSKAFYNILFFIQSINTETRNKQNTDPCHESQTTLKILSCLQTMDSWIDDIPPEKTPQRFGNKSFRIWMNRFETQCLGLLNEIMVGYESSFVELKSYFLGAFGNGIRIDYGSGHELSFIVFLYCLYVLGIMNHDDLQAISNRIFVRYIELVRRLVSVYLLEPAGSHGVWGLDDYHFLTYYWGSSQLLDHPRIKPKSIMQKDIIDHFSATYMYLGSINYISQAKTGPFHEHSPLLYDISGVANWQKVNQGLLKMYIAEVLQKFPVIQHLYFGSLLSFEGCEMDSNNESNEINS